MTVLSKQRKWLSVLAVAACICGQPAWALINLKLTPAELIRESDRLCAVTVQAPANGHVAAKTTQTIKGEALEAWDLDAGDLDDATQQDLTDAFGEAKSVIGFIMTKAAGATPADEKDADGAIQIGTHWYALRRDGAKWKLAKDERDINAIWAGSARQLAAAAKYVVADPKAAFPVQSSLHWDSDQSLAKVGKGTRGLCVADLGGTLGRCVLVLSADGDRLLRLTEKGETEDITAKSKLAGASVAAAFGDFNADGRLDIATTDGKDVWVATQQADGTFGRTQIPDAPACNGLATIDVAGHAALVATSAAGPVVLVPAGGKWSVVDLVKSNAATLGKLGAAGVCVVADFTGDGVADILQCYAEGVALLAGQRDGTFAAARVSTLKPPAATTAAMACDLDMDGRLDVVVAGADGMAYLRQRADGTFEDATEETAELAYHGNANQPKVLAVAPSDVNADGRVGLVAFYAKYAPRAFFSRGFACLGLARELSLQDSELASAKATVEGTLAGTVADIRGDGSHQLLMVDPEGTLWTLRGIYAKDKATPNLTIALSPRQAGPLTLIVGEVGRVASMVVVRPGQPVVVPRATAGAVKLQWMDHDGKAQAKTLFVRKADRVELP